MGRQAVVASRHRLFGLIEPVEPIAVLEFDAQQTSATTDDEVSGFPIRTVLGQWISTCALDLCKTLVYRAQCRNCS